MGREVSDGWKSRTRDGDPNWSGRMSKQVATLTFLHEKTSIPLPRVIGHGLIISITSDFPSSLSNMLPGSRSPSCGTKPNQEEIDMRQLAQVTLQLNSHTFNKIGSLTLDNRGCWSVNSRPLTHDHAALRYI